MPTGRGYHIVYEKTVPCTRVSFVSRFPAVLDIWFVPGALRMRLYYASYSRCVGYMVRLRFDAVRRETLPVREQRTVRCDISGAIHRRRLGPDARMVLL